MKANSNIKLREDSNGYAAIVGGVVALLISIIVGILVYWAVVGGITSSSTSETFTGYTLPTGTLSVGTNTSAWSVAVAQVPSSISNVTCWNSTGNTESYPAFTLSYKTVSVAAGAASGFNQVNVTYVSRAYTEESSTNTMASTVFSLLPVIAIVAIGSIMIALVVGFGSSGKKT